MPRSTPERPSWARHHAGTCASRPRPTLVYVEAKVARARYPLGLPSGITAQPQVGSPWPSVMPEVGRPEVWVMARGEAAFL